MSYAVVRGAPTPSQLYMDQVLAAAGPGNNLFHVILHSMKSNPNGIMMTNAATGETFTNSEILHRIARFSRAVSARSYRSPVLVMLANSEDVVSVYYGLTAAGVVPFMYDPNVTQYELKYFAKLVEASLIICEPRLAAYAVAAVKELGTSAQVVSRIQEKIDGVVSFEDFVQGYSEEWKDFKCVDVSPDDTTLMVPTSGTTGLQKAAVVAHKGMVAQLPILWHEKTKFPTPEDGIFLVSSPQWLTHSMILTSSQVYQIPIVMTPETLTPKLAVDIIRKYKPTWMLVNPVFAAGMVAEATPEDLVSIRHMVLCGSPLTTEVREAIREKLSPTSRVINGFGMTETSGFITMQNPDSPKGSIGRVCNILDYKIVNEAGREVSASEEGELLLKSDHVIFKGYYKNKAATLESLSEDGWLRSGDIVRADDSGNLYYVKRKKLGFKFRNWQVSPEELENVIQSVPGVKDCAVCGVTNGPAAILVLEAGANATNVTELAKKTVETSLTDYKRLRGGVAVVDAIPRNTSGKIARREVQALVDDLNRKSELV